MIEGITPPHHYDMKSFKLLDAKRKKEGFLGVSLSLYLPGAYTDFGEQPLETAYYILAGELLLETEKTQYKVQTGQIVHIRAGEYKRLRNVKKETAEVLVIVNTSEAEQ